jgi:orotate phosphoribosyltransferase
MERSVANLVKREAQKARLQDMGVILMEGHFDYGNGYHGQVYVNMRRLLCHPGELMRFVQAIVDLIPAEVKERVDIVAGPVSGGAIVAYSMAIALEGIRPVKGPAVLSMAIEKEGKGFKLHPFNVALLRDRNRDRARNPIAPFDPAVIHDTDRNRSPNVLLIDDVYNTGDTDRQCRKLIENHGGVVEGTVVLVNRNQAATHLFSLTDEFTGERFVAETCPLCRLKVPITQF